MSAKYTAMNGYRATVLKSEKNKQNLQFESLAIHAGQAPDTTTGAVIPPIYQTSTYQQQSPGEHTGYEYSRTQNPSRQALEECLAALENTKHAAVFASGMAAIHCIVQSMLNDKPSGLKILCSDDVYGGTFRILDKVFKPLNIEIEYIDFNDKALVDTVLTQHNFDMLWLESPSNPMLKLIDIEWVADKMKVTQKNCKLVVDNTFASPYLQNPMNLGADMVVHSLTKYIAGHSDLVGGALMCKDDVWFEKIRFLQNSIGAVLGPFDAWLCLRGLKTLALRMQQHCKSALALAHYFKSLDCVDKVYYPGLPDHPNHDLIHSQQKGLGGGMISVAFKFDLKQCVTFLESLDLFILAESLGGVESLVEHPATMTHASLPKEKRDALGIVDGFVRFSVGIEHMDDLKADIEQALEKVV